MNLVYFKRDARESPCNNPDSRDSAAGSVEGGCPETLPPIRHHHPHGRPHVTVQWPATDDPSNERS